MSALAGLGPLLRATARAERGAIAAWLAVFAALGVGVTRRYGLNFPTDAAVQAFAHEVQRQPVLMALGGQLPAATLGGLVAWKLADTLFCLVAVMAMTIVVRQTRGAEDQGRMELVRAGAVGRLAPLGAAVGVTVGAGLAAGGACAAGMIAMGLAPAGAIALGLAMAAVGAAFAAIAALAAELAPDARNAGLLAGGVLAAAYVARLLADGAGRPALRLLSPLGWGHLVSPFGADAFGWLALPAIAAAVLLAVAAGRARARDLGAGAWPAEAGREGRAPAGPFALAWRLQRGLLAGWAIGVGALAAIVAVAIPRLPGAVTSGPVMAEFMRRYATAGGAAFPDVIMWVALLSLGYAAALYPILALLRLRAEETAGRAETVLAGAVSRGRLYASHLAVALGGGAALTTGAGAIVASAGGAGPDALLAGLLLAPAVWAAAAPVALAVGLAPRAATAVGWAVFGFINLFGEILGPAAGLDYWLADLAVPFHHVPQVMTGGAVTPGPVLALLAVAALGMAAGAWGFARRDIG